MAAVQMSEAQRITQEIHIPEGLAQAARKEQRALDKQAKKQRTEAHRLLTNMHGAEGAAARRSAGRRQLSRSTLAEEEAR
eukprot:7390675-Prymnesium_polylepis.1